MAAADDYILTPEDVQALQRHAMSSPPEQVTRVFDHGGHVGLMFAPQIRESMMDFMGRAPQPQPSPVR